jgi:hypothetical protein
MVSSEPDVEECDATQVEISGVAGLIIFLKKNQRYVQVCICYGGSYFIIGEGNYFSFAC